MKLSYLVAACLLACLTSGVASAQTRTFNRDAGFTVGVNVPMYKGVEADATVGFTYVNSIITVLVSGRDFNIRLAWRRWTMPSVCLWHLLIGQGPGVVGRGWSRG